MPARAASSWSPLDVLGTPAGTPGGALAAANALHAWTMPFVRYRTCDLATRGLIEEINRVEAALKQQFPVIKWCFFEPDFTDED